MIMLREESINSPGPGPPPFLYFINFICISSKEYMYESEMKADNSI